MATDSREPPISPDGEYIDIRAVVLILWDAKKLLIASTFLGTLVFLGAAFVLNDVYKSEALLAPNSQDDVSALSGLASQYSGLASLAGFDLGDSSVDRTAIGIEVLKSRRFLSEFINRHNLLIPIFAAQSWDPVTRELSLDDSVYDAEAEQWVRDASAPRQSKPSDLEAVEAFSEMLEVTRNKDEGFVRISIQHISPDFAQDCVKKLIADLNAQTMSEDVEQAQQAIDYLNQQVAETSLTELRSIFYRLIEEQTKTIVLSRSTPEYLLRVIDPPVTPEEPVSPNRPAYVVFGAFLGLFAGFVMVFVRRVLQL